MTSNITFNTREREREYAKDKENSERKKYLKVHANYTGICFFQ